MIDWQIGRADSSHVISGDTPVIQIGSRSYRLSAGQIRRLYLGYETVRVGVTRQRAISSKVSRRGERRISRDQILVNRDHLSSLRCGRIVVAYWINTARTGTRCVL